MWNVNGKTIKMTEGYYGVELPISVSGAEFTTGDQIKFTLKTAVNGTDILDKTFSDITDNTIKLTLTSAESDLLTPGEYAYSLDWFRSGVFLCNIIATGVFKVEDKT